MKKNRFANPDFLHWRLGEANDAVAATDASSAGDGGDVSVETKQADRKSFLRKGEKCEYIGLSHTLDLDEQHRKTIFVDIFENDN